MNNTIFDDKSIERFFKASHDLMQLGSSFKSNIDTAMGTFKEQFSTALKSHFVDQGVSEMLSASFSELEKQMIANLEGLNDICTRGGQWYAFYFGTAVGRPTSAPAENAVAERPLQAKAQRT